MTEQTHARQLSSTVFPWTDEHIKAERFLHRYVRFAANIPYKPQREICCINSHTEASRVQQSLRSVSPIFHLQINVLLQWQRDFRDTCISIRFSSLDVGSSVSTCKVSYIGACSGGTLRSNPHFLNTVRII